jgi:hypothetical protein
MEGIEPNPNKTYENSSLSKPLYLFCDQEKKFFIFITSSLETCFIKEENTWEMIKIKALTRYNDGDTKNYSFAQEAPYKSVNIPTLDQENFSLVKWSDEKIVLEKLELSAEILRELNVPNVDKYNLSNLPDTKEIAQQMLISRMEQDKHKEQHKKIKSIISSLTQAKKDIASLDEPSALNLPGIINVLEQKLDENVKATEKNSLFFNLLAESDSTVTKNSTEEASLLLH